VGGGARSAFWAQMLASALDVEIVTHGGSAVGGALGAARLGALSVGAPLDSVCLPPPVDTVYQPDPGERALLAPRHALFRSLYRRP
jgi:xylulokinase